MRLTKFNPETGEYEYKEHAKTQEEFNAQRKAVIQRLGELEDRAEGEWKDRYENKYANHYYECSLCGKPALDRNVDNGLGNPRQEQALSPYCPWCGARMKGADNEQR